LEKGDDREERQDSGKTVAIEVSSEYSIGADRYVSTPRPDDVNQLITKESSRLTHS
jgi:hypothetical protein